jgi:hypothetical protein
VLELKDASTDATAAVAPVVTPETTDPTVPTVDPTALLTVEVTAFVDEGTILNERELENKEKRLPKPLLILLLVVVDEVLGVPTV